MYYKFSKKKTKGRRGRTNTSGKADEEDVVEDTKKKGEISVPALVVDAITFLIDSRGK